MDTLSITTQFYLVILKCILAIHTVAIIKITTRITLFFCNDVALLVVRSLRSVPQILIMFIRDVTSLKVWLKFVTIIDFDESW